MLSLKKDASYGELAILAYYEHLLKTTRRDELHIKLLSRLHNILESTRRVFEHRANIAFFVTLFSALAEHCDDAVELKLWIDELASLESIDD